MHRYELVYIYMTICMYEYVCTDVYMFIYYDCPITAFLHISTESSQPSPGFHFDWELQRTRRALQVAPRWRHMAMVLGEEMGETLSCKVVMAGQPTPSSNVPPLEMRSYYCKGFLTIGWFPLTRQAIEPLFLRGVRFGEEFRLDQP